MVNRIVGGRVVPMCENCHAIRVGFHGAWCLRCQDSFHPRPIWKGCTLLVIAGLGVVMICWIVWIGG